MKITNIQCDVCGASSVYDNEFKKDYTLQIIFNTEQGEGYPCKPYLSNQKMDLCCDCWGNILEGNYIFGQGAQGHNVYFFKRNDVLLDGVVNGK